MLVIFTAIYIQYTHSLSLLAVSKSLPSPRPWYIAAIQKQYAAASRAQLVVWFGSVTD